MGQFFNVTVKPIITASLQHTAAFADGDVLFDWTAFNIPKGAAKLTNVTMLIRGTDGAPQTARDINFYFAKSRDAGATAPGSLGTINATADGTGYYNHLISKVHIEASGDYATGLDYMSVATTGHGAANNQGNLNIVLQGEADSGSSVGYDKLYIGGIAAGALDFSTAALTDDAVDVSGLSEAKITTLDGTACNKVFTPGDIIHAEDDIIVGEVKSVDANNITFKTDGSVQYHAGGETLFSNPDGFAAWQIQNGAGAAGDLANNDELYVLHPITLILSFEQ